MKADLSKPMRGRVWKFGDSVDTDVIAPTHRAQTPDDMKKITMDAHRPEFAKEVKPGDIIVGGKSFGFGSHRQSASTVLPDVGVQAIVAESVARLFFRINISIAVPTFVVPGVSALVQDGEEIEIDYPAGVVRNPQTGKEIPLAKYPPLVENIFRAGGIIPLLIERRGKARR